MLQVGVASRDITPRLGGDFFGYVRPDLRARGVASRLHAHALVLDDGDAKVCLLTVDLGAPLITPWVLERVAPLGYDATNLVVAATHTHAGPNRPGGWVAQRAAQAVAAADAARVPARAAWSQVRLDDANRTRSLEAHLANHGLDLYPGTGTLDLDPDGEDHPRDVDLRLLRVDAADGRPLAAWAHFSAHPTTIGPANVHFSSDYPGAATRHFRRAFGPDTPVAIVTNGNEGDLIPTYDEVNQHACADRTGRRVADAMRRAWDGATPTAEVAVASRGQRIEYAGQEVAPGRRVGDRPWFGLPFIGGGMNGPSFFFGLGLEGRRRPRWLASPVHGRKLLAMPGPHPRHADITVVRIGDRLLLSVPGEPTVETGRRTRAAALEAAAGACTDAMVVGLAQSYLGYFTTPEEYDQQHYEGGHTVFGRHTSLLVERTHAALTAALVTGGGPAPVVAPDPGSGRWSSPDGVQPPGRTPARRLRVLTEPPEVVARFDTITFAWRGARRGDDRPLDRPFLVLERRDEDGSFVAVADDLDVGTVWEQRGRRYQARYEVPADLPLGRYRFAVRGVAADLTSRVFAVVASDALRLLGVDHAGGTLVFHAQHPPPDPRVVLRARERSPSGGTVRCVVDGQRHEATWDATADGWTLTLPAVPATVDVPPGGLVDGHGNRSGSAVTLRVGEVAAIGWPPPHGPGGGRPPGVFGTGVLGPPMVRRPNRSR